ncbi:MAG: Pyridoxal phosphate homeostasis protein [Chlamydiae bacterium]|nr:Pyridoxal phosphate homeostasis protein [Chlamydiota bacterium]
MILSDFKRELVSTLKELKRDENRVRFLIASKYFEMSEILDFYHQGVRDFGENRVQEALIKMEQLPKDIRWHFLGHLQSNKIGKIKNRFALIHSIDSLALAKKLSNAIEKTQPILIQIKTSTEETKTGFDLLEFKEVYEELKSLPHLSIKGLMTVAPKGTISEVQNCFKQLQNLKEEICPSWELSMGMSYDYKLALSEGATWLRIGRLLKSRE